MIRARRQGGLLVLLAVVGLTVACAAPPAERTDGSGATPGAAGPRVALVGDSQVAWGRWEELLGQPVLNRGISGQTVADTLATLDAQLQGTDDVRTVVVWAGTNDVLRDVPPEQVHRDLDQLLTRVGELRAGADVLVLTLPPLPARPAEVEAVNARITEAAEHAGASIVDVLPALTGDGLLQDDGVHLTDAGYRAAAQELARHLTS